METLLVIYFGGMLANLLWVIAYLRITKAVYHSNLDDRVSFLIIMWPLNWTIIALVYLIFVPFAYVTDWFSVFIAWSLKQ